MREFAHIGRLYVAAGEDDTTAPSVCAAATRTRNGRRVRLEFTEHVKHLYLLPADARQWGHALIALADELEAEGKKEDKPDA